MRSHPASGHTFIDSDGALASLVERMNRAGRIALDTEADSLHHYYEKVCLIQLAVDRKVYLVDPLSGTDLSRFLRVLSRKPLVFHGAEYDLRMLKSSFGFGVHGEVFDTMLAAQLLGYEQLGLAALVDRFFGVNLSKSGQRSDWSRRPLTQSQLDYAGDDARYLEPLADRLASDLDRFGRTAWHREACRRMVVGVAQTNSRPTEDAWRIKGVSKLDRRQMAFVREIWKWREKEAKRVDRPPFKIMGNDAVLALALWAAAHPRAPLERGPRLPRHCRGKRFAALKRAIRRARDLPQSQWPDLRKPRGPKPPGPEPKQLVEALRSECTRIAEELEIPSSVVAPRAALVAIARHRPHSLRTLMESGPLMKWQADLLQPAVQRLLKEHPMDPSTAPAGTPLHAGLSS